MRREKNSSVFGSMETSPQRRSWIFQGTAKLPWGADGLPREKTPAGLRKARKPAHPEFIRGGGVARIHFLT